MLGGSPSARRGALLVTGRVGMRRRHAMQHPPAPHGGHAQSSRSSLYSWAFAAISPSIKEKSVVFDFPGETCVPPPSGVVVLVCDSRKWPEGKPAKVASPSTNKQTNA